MALPMGMSSRTGLGHTLPIQDILKALDETEELSWTNLTLIANKGDAAAVRDATVRLALIKAFQTSLGRAGKENSPLTANLLGKPVLV